MDLQFWPGAVKMVIIAAVTVSFITNNGRSAWFVGALLVFIYVIFAMILMWCRQDRTARPDDLPAARIIRKAHHFLEQDPQANNSNVLVLDQPKLAELHL